MRTRPLNLRTTAVVVGLQSVVEGEGDLKAVGAGLAAVVAAGVGADINVEKRAVSTDGDLVLDEGDRVEAVAGLVGPQVPPASGLLVESDLGLGVGGAERGVKGAGEETLTDEVAALDHHTAAAALAARLPSAVLGALVAVGRANDGRSLVVTVGASDDDVEVVAPLTSVGGAVLGDGAAEQSALDVGSRGQVGAEAIARVTVLAGVTLKVDVEASAEAGGIAEVGAGLGVVGIERLVRQVGAELRSTVEVREVQVVVGRHASGGSGSRSRAVEGRVRKESRVRVGRRDGARARGEGGAVGSNRGRGSLNSGA